MRTYLRQNGRKIMSLLLCFLFLFFVGCGDGGGGGDDDDDYDLDESLATPISMDGTKVLSKPSDYDFADAVGDYSVNYYNLFAREVLYQLYKVYETSDISDLQDLLSDLDINNGITYTSDNFSNYQYYLYDSLRYTITSVETVTDSAGSVTQYVTINSTPWNWTISSGNPNDAIYNSNEIIFINVVENAGSYSGAFSIEYNSNSSTYTFSVQKDVFDDWVEIYELSGTNIIPDFLEYYSNSGVTDEDNESIYIYWNSPYYEEIYGKINSGDDDAVNYFQDALEYAVYLFVLGYDYNNADDEAYFDFDIQYENGLVSDILVGGWEDEPISIVDALANAKILYENIGGYIGITETNKEQITEFIIDFIIGEDAYDSNQFKVSFSEKNASGVTTSSSSVSFNRNYDDIISNIVEYACTKAPIGSYTYVDDDGNTQVEILNLDNAYLASQITDYDGDYFQSYWGDEEGNEMFQHIEAAEYQSIVIYPNEDDFYEYLEENGEYQSVGDIWLAFEYYGEDTDTKEYADSITINVGVRYYDHEAGQYTANYQYTMTIEFGEFPTDSDADDYEERFDANVIYMMDTDDGDLCFGEDGVVIKDLFNQDIGNGAINPFANQSDLESSDYASITITGQSSARNYYMLNDSTTYGVYGTLNPEMFNSANVDDGCDYLEIYFDVVKDKYTSNINYNFKVCILGFFMAEEV